MNKSKTISKLSDSKLDLILLNCKTFKVLWVQHQDKESMKKLFPLIHQDTAIQRNLDHPNAVQPNVVCSYSYIRGKCLYICIWITIQSYPNVNLASDWITYPQQLHCCSWGDCQQWWYGGKVMFMAFGCTYPFPIVSLGGENIQINISENHIRQMQLSHQNQNLILRGATMQDVGC